MIDKICIVLIAVLVIYTWILEEQDHDIELKLAEDYAEMLEREAACETWECIQNVEME